MNLIIYDILTKSSISIESKNITKTSREMGVDFTMWYKLSSGYCSSIGSRYLLESDKNKLFVLVDLDTKEEFECICNKSIFVHLNSAYDYNEGKYIDALRRGRQTVATICGRALHLKGQTKERRSPSLKAKSPEYKKQLNEASLRLKISSRLRSRIGQIIKSKSFTKARKSSSLLGCDMRFFVGYFEAKFQSGMSWENYGKWHIDHIIPLASAKKEPELIELCHYSNLQPLWAKDNISKGAKF